MLLKSHNVHVMVVKRVFVMISAIEKEKEKAERFHGNIRVREPETLKELRDVTL